MKTLREAIEDIKGFNDFATVLNYYGHSLNNQNKCKCPLPLHNEKTGSFSLRSDGFFKCYGCGTSGDIVDFVSSMENISNVVEATKFTYNILCKPFNVELSKIEKFEEFMRTCNDGSPATMGDDYVFERMHIYYDENGVPVYAKNRYKAIGPKADKPKTFTTRSLIETEHSFKFGSIKDVKKVIYNLPRVKNAIENNRYIFFVEGEKDAETLMRLGFASTTVMSSSSWDNAYTEQLINAKIVFIGDTGAAGEKFKRLVWNNLKDVISTFKVVSLKGIDKLGDNADVTDWINEGYTKEDLLQCIKDSWDWKISSTWKDVNITVKKDGSVEIKPKKTIDNFELLLNRTNTKLYFNEISKCITVETKFFENANLNTLATEMQTQAVKEGFNCTIQDVNNWLNVIAYKNSINPFKTWLEGLEEWDGVDRFQEFCNTFETVEYYPEGLKELIVYKWLLHFIASAYEPNFKGQGILILKGKQGIGKTTCMSKLIPINEPWAYLSEQKFENNRDCIQTITSNQLVELSEFARSNKEIDALKGFVTTETDKMVLKYDKYPVEYKRIGRAHV